MKPESRNCIIAIIIFLLGLIGIVLCSLIPGFESNVRNVLILLTLCCAFVGLISFMICYKKYTIIQSLKTGTNVIAHWSFDASQNSIISKALIVQKNNNYATASLATFLGIIFSITLALSDIKCMWLIAVIIAILSFVGLFLAIYLIKNDYKYKFTHPCNVIFSKDSIYYLGEIFYLNKSIYFLEDIIIKNGDEPSISFIYGQTDTNSEPIFTLEIPIPPGKALAATQIQKYYYDLIKYED